MNRLLAKGVIVGMLTILLVAAVSASTSCPCSRPGKPGTLIGFTCSNGTTDNVIFYNDSAPTIGETFRFWAFKDIRGNEVPVNNLTVAIMIGSETISKLTTDHNGYASFKVESPGDYKINGGDAIMSFSVAGMIEEEPINASPGSGNAGVPDEQASVGPDEVFGNDSEIGKPCVVNSDCKLPFSYAAISRCPYEIRCAQNKCEAFCPWDENPPDLGQQPAGITGNSNTPKGSDNSLLIIVVVAVVVIALFFLTRGRKCFRHRKSSGFSGKKLR